MRINTGKLKGRSVKAVQNIRPTKDMVKKAIFDILGDIEGLTFLDLFAGSGAVGLEAMSRGASLVMLVEKDRACLKAIEENIRALSLDNCEVYPQEAFEAVKQLQARKRVFDVIFLDPPYHEDTAKKILQTLSACDILARNGFVVVEHSSGDDLPELFNNLSLFDKRTYGITGLSFYRKINTKS